MKKLWVPLFALVLQSTLVISQFEVDSNRLLRNFEPLHYDLSIIPDLKQQSFYGYVHITFRASANVSEYDLQFIELNSYGLNIDFYNDVTLQEGKNYLKIGMIGEYKTFEKLLIFPVTPLQKETDYVLHIQFNGNIMEAQDNSGGLIISSYKVDNETSEYLLANLFPVYARRVFPCFDEPYFKATFTLSVSRPIDYQTISNMPVARVTHGIDEHGKTIIWDTFQETPPMAPSSLGLIISQLYSVTNETAKINYLGPTPWHAQIMSEEPYFYFILQLFEKKFSYTFPLPYLNFVFIPDLYEETFESWGIIYIRSNELFYHINTTNYISPSDEEWNSQHGNIIGSVKLSQQIHRHVAKEVTSQFFGDTVSPEWWDDVWIRDGFSEYFGHFLASKFEHSLDVTKFLSGYLRPLVLEYQSEKSNKEPLVGNYSDCSIPELLASLSKQKGLKGAAVIFMLSCGFSHKVFDPPFIQFLHRGALNTSTTGDFIQLWQDELDHYNYTLTYNLTAEKIVKSWLQSDGVPLITVTRLREPKENQTLVISQQTINPIERDPFSKWYLPLTYTTARECDFSNTTAKIWFGPHFVRNKTQHTLKIYDAVGRDDWILFNTKATGLYRVLYDDSDLILIANQLKENFTVIDEMNRAQIVDDIFSLTWIGDVSYKAGLEVTEYLEYETEFYPWFSAYRGFTKLNRILYQNTSVYNHIVEYIKPLLNNIYDTIGFYGHEQDDFTKIMLRAETLKWACDFDIGDCREEAKTVADKILNGSLIRPVLDDYLEPIFCGAIQYTDSQSFWYEVYEFYNQRRDTLNEGYILDTLACSNDPEIIDNYLDFIVSPDEVTSKEAVLIFNAVAKRNTLVDIATSFLSSNAVIIKDMYNESTLPRIITNIGYYLTTQEQYDTIRDMTHLEIGNDSLIAINKTLQQTENSIRWLKTFVPEINLYFNETITTTTQATIETTTHKGSAVQHIAQNYSFIFIIISLFMLIHILHL